MNSAISCVEIAGLCIGVTADSSFGVSLPPEYAPFRMAASTADDADLLLRLHREPVAPVGAGVSCGTWTLCREGVVRRIIWHADQPEAPRWAARFTPGDREVPVACAGDVARDQPGKGGRYSPFRYPMDQLLLMYALAERGLGIVHAAGWVKDGVGWVAAGRSGAGKSTLARCWAARHGTDSLLSDDRVIVGLDSRGGSGPQVSGTPWPGELRVASNRTCPLGGLVFLRQAKENRLRPLSTREAVERSLPLTSIPWFDPEYLALALTNMERLISRIPAYEFQFTPDEGAVRALETLRT